MLLVPLPLPLYQSRMSRGKNIKGNKSRLDFIVWLVFLISAFFLYRLFDIQVLKHDFYRAMAEEQYWRLQELPARRGDILSSDGYSLATTKNSYLLYGEPKNIENPLQTAHALAHVLSRNREGENSDQVFESLKDRYYEVLNLDLYWVALEHRLSEGEKAQIEKLGIAGIGFEEEPERFYPEGTLAAHVLGFVGSDEEGNPRGYYGVEGNLNGDLEGKPGRVIEERDASGAPILTGGYRRVDPLNGRDVVLTIDRSVQYIVEKILQDGVLKYGALSGSAIVMDPFTGDVIAMTNFPSFHPEKYNKEIYENIEASEATYSALLKYSIEKKNLAISDTYEPGSVLKGVTISAAIDLGKVTPKTTFVDNGPKIYSGYTIDNWDGKHHGVQTIVELLQKSNNIGAAWVGHLLGAKNLSAYMKKFGIGEMTRIDLEGEDTGVVRAYREWTDIDLATAAFGQGVSATPLQILNSFNVIANGGDLVKPRIVSKVVEKDKVIEIPVKKIRRVIAKESSDTMVFLLTEAVSGGESKFYNIKNYAVAGKTGTAQISVDGKYHPEKTNVTFAGFLPNSRKYTLIVRLKEPSSSVFAAETAVPLWMDITRDLIRYYGIPPED